jgi:class 3 adenylate cyclase
MLFSRQLIVDLIKNLLRPALVFLLACLLPLTLLPRRSSAHARPRRRATRRYRNAGGGCRANGEPFQVGIALHFGSVTCGNVGLDAQRDATIIGDVVNTVFRLESVMKELNQAVLPSADFGDRLPPGEKPVDLGERKLKGKQQAVRIYGMA